MLEFLTAIFIYIACLFGIATSNIKELPTSDNVRFTIVVDSEELGNTTLHCGNDSIKYMPIDYKAEVVRETNAYMNPDLTGASLELPIGKIVQLNSISAFGDIYTFTYNDMRMYVRSVDLNIINENILGIPFNSYTDIEDLPSIFQADGDNCIEGIQYAYALFQMLPQYIQQDVYKSGYEIIVTDTPIEDIYEQEDESKVLAGVCSHGDKKIFLKNKAYAIKYSLYHELAHLLDHEWGNLSSSEEVVNIYTEECSKFSGSTVLKTGYHAESEQEYFACALQGYLMLGSSGLKEVPRTQEYIQRILAASMDKYQ